MSMLNYLQYKFRQKSMSSAKPTFSLRRQSYSIIPFDEQKFGIDTIKL